MHIDCAGYFREAVETSKKVGLPVWAEPGSWGGLSPDLQRLPAGGELCGATYLGDPKDNPKDKPNFATVFFRSALYGDDLRRFWDPVLTPAGCTFKKDETDQTRTKLVWTCPAAKGGTVTVLTDERYELYSIGFLKR